MTPKPCKWCGSIWHSKNKCVKSPLYGIKKAKGTNPPLSRSTALDGLRTPYKGKSDRSQLIGLADKYHSAYVRASSDKCYTCGRMTEDLQNGHFINRRFLKTRWNNLNCHPQCTECNVIKQGNLEVYQLLLRKEYGELAVDTLFEMARRGDKVTNLDIQEVIDKYRLVF